MPEPYELMEWAFDDAMVAFAKAKTRKARLAALTNALFALEDLEKEVDRLYEQEVDAEAA